MFIFGYFEFFRNLIILAVALFIMKLLENKFKKIIVFVPIVCMLLCLPSVIMYGSVMMGYLAEAVNQFNRVSEWTNAYAKHMSYLYTDQLLLALQYFGYLAINLIPSIGSSIYYYKLNKKNKMNHEIKKMKIKDL